jgi:hypothetical protein
MMVGLFAAPGASRVPRSDRAWRSHAGSDAVVMIFSFDVKLLAGSVVIDAPG